MISKFIKTLKGIGIDPTAEDVADMLWLAGHLDCHLDKAVLPVEKADFELSEPIECPLQSEPHDDIGIDVDTTPQSDGPCEEYEKKKALPRAELYPYTSVGELTDEQSGTGGFPFRASSGPALAGKLEIGQALRPLMRKFPSISRMIFDENATVHSIAESNIWIPVLKPVPSKWLDVIMLAEESPSMIIWRETLVELQDVLEIQGAFRNIRRWSFTYGEDSKRILLYEGDASNTAKLVIRNPKELIEPSGRRLIIVVSDCVSQIWHDGTVTEMLNDWKANSRIAVLHMFPHWLWERTGLGKAEPVYMRSSYPGAVNAKLEVEVSSLEPDAAIPDGLFMPVITLEPRSLLPWAKFVAGIGGLWIPGFVLNLSSAGSKSECLDLSEDKSNDFQSPSYKTNLFKKILAMLGFSQDNKYMLQQDKVSKHDQYDSLHKPSPEELLDIFQSIASPEAQMLVAYFAAVPLNLSIMRFVQNVMLPQAKQIHLAEVLLSGLIKRKVINLPLIHPQEVEYEFVEGVRNSIISRNRISQTIAGMVPVFDRLSCFIDKNTGKPIAFQTLLADPSSAKRILIKKGQQSLASVAIDVLRYLGGNYGRLASYLEEKNRTDLPNEIYVIGKDEGQENSIKAFEWIFDLQDAELTARYFIEIEKRAGKYVGKIHMGEPHKRHLFVPDLTVGTENFIKIKNKLFSWKDITAILYDFNSSIHMELFDEQGQLEIGTFLFQAIFGNFKLSDIQQERKEIEIRIVTGDEHIRALPWTLLAHHGTFITDAGASVSLSSSIAMAACELSILPKILVIAPQPQKSRKAQAKKHLDELKDLLASYDQSLSSPSNLLIVGTWNEFVKQIKTFEPEIIYYYMQDIQPAKQLPDFIFYLKTMKTPPILIYFNCYFKSVEDFLDVGDTTINLIPAVIINRPKVQSNHAQNVALALLKQILLKGTSPHHAVSNLNSYIDIQTANTWHITPVLIAHYDRWKSKPFNPVITNESHPVDTNKLARTKQYNTVMAQTLLMVREQKPKSLVFVWYGQKGQGVEIFHKRLRVEFQEQLANVEVCQVRPRWPFSIEDSHNAFSDVLVEAFNEEFGGINYICDIPSGIARKSKGKPVLVYVRHEPVWSFEVINPQSFIKYIEWWKNVFAPVLEERQFAVLTVSFMVENPSTFGESIKNENIFKLDSNNMLFWLLDELKNVTEDDLRLFFLKYNTKFPSDLITETCVKILNKTGGKYESTVEELKRLYTEAWKADKKDNQ